MSGDSGAQAFFEVSYNVGLYGGIIVYSVMGIDVLIAIGYMLHTQGWRNYTLFILLLLILVYAIEMDVSYILLVTERENAPYALLDAVSFALDGWIHWVITQSYIKVAYETSQLLDKDVLFNDPVKIEAVARFKSRIKTANLLCPLLVLAFSVCIYFGTKLDSFWFYNVGSYGWLALMTIFTLVWGWTL